MEVNGSLVGDSPYLVMFEVDDGAELQPEDEDGNGFVTGKVWTLDHPRMCSPVYQVPNAITAKICLVLSSSPYESSLMFTVYLLA